MGSVSTSGGGSTSRLLNFPVSAFKGRVREGSIPYLPSACSILSYISCHFLFGQRYCPLSRRSRPPILNLYYNNNCALRGHNRYPPTIVPIMESGVTSAGSPSYWHKGIVLSVHFCFLVLALLPPCVRLSVRVGRPSKPSFFLPPHRLFLSVVFI